MPRIRIERVPIQVMKLGWFGGDHMHLALEQDHEVPQDLWYIFEGTRDDNETVLRLGVAGSSGFYTLSASYDGLNGDALVAAIGTPETRGSRVIPIPGGDEQALWTDMASLAGDFEQQRYPYIAFATTPSPLANINSSSVVSSLLYWEGIDIAQHLPQGLRFAPGWKTILGTVENDNITLESAYKHIYGGEGEDVLGGMAGNIIPEKLYGGLHNDVFNATSGNNIYHGGEYGLDYVEDGVDAVLYQKIGVSKIIGNPYSSEHSIAEFYVVHTGGFDQYFSIERLRWSVDSDMVLIGPNVEAIPEHMKLELDEESSLDNGDTIDFAEAGASLLINYDGEGTTIVQAQVENANAGIWVENVEWIIGSAMDDQIYTAPELRGAEGGDGNDLIDIRASTPQTEHSPHFYDIEVNGGAGSDTIVAGKAWGLADGGDGSDVFILSNVFSSTESFFEFVIQGGDPGDRIYVPYNLFNKSGGDFDGSALFPLLGAMANHQGKTSFLDLPDEANGGAGEFFAFQWQTQFDRHYGSDETDGVIDFAGGIVYSRFGNDLIIRFYQGAPQVVADVGSDEEPWIHTVNKIEALTEAAIVIENFEEGDYGIKFYDPGALNYVTVYTDHGPYELPSYSNWDTAVQAMTNGGQMMAPYDDTRPEAPAFEPDEQAPGSGPAVVVGSGGDDVIAVTARSEIDGGTGNDTITGSKDGDVLDGGSGDDHLSGGGGDDTYVVDAAADTVVETASGGRDRIVSRIDYALPDHVETLQLGDAALSGTGNSLANAIIGNAGANTLYGLDGNDHLSGNAGNDTLEGGSGSDAYLYVEGDGNDLIRDIGLASDNDVLVLESYTPDQISLFRLTASPDDLIVALPDGSRIRIESFDGPTGAGIEVVRFSAGVTWSKAQFDQLAAAAPILDNDAPFARSDYEFMAGSGTIVIPTASLLTNDSDGDGHTLSIIAINNVSANASITLRPDGDLDLSTPEGFDGLIGFSYTVSDGYGGQSTADVEVQIIPNHAPVATAVLPAESVAEGSPWTYTFASTLFTDEDNNFLNYGVTLQDGSPLPAWLTFDASTRTLSGTPPHGFTGVLNLAITADDRLSLASAPLQLTVTPDNRSPVALADMFTTTRSVPLVIDSASLTANDTDPDGDPLSVASVQDAIHGSISIDETGSVVFTPDAGYTGPASFSYTVSDGRGGTASAVVSITVEPPPAGQTFTGTNLGETITGTAGSDSIEGRGGNDTLIGLDGDDTFIINGNDGYDTFDGGLGADSIRGGAGNDILGLSAAMASLAGIEAIDLGAGRDILRLTAASETLDLSNLLFSGVEEIQAAGGHDTIIGTSERDVINGGTGNDTLTARDGDDDFLATGNAGYDVFDGGLGFDRVLGAGTNDTIGLRRGSLSLAGIEAIDGGDGVDVLRLLSAATLDLTAIAVTGIEEIRGSTGADIIIGTALGDRIRGGAGNDVLSGGGGNDVFLVSGSSNLDEIYGGSGYNVVLGSTGNDRFSFANVTGNLSGIALIDGGGGTDIIQMTAGNDFLDLSGIFLAGIMSINMGNGHDRIVGSDSGDIISGGSGNDTFVFAGRFGHDTIVDFQRGSASVPIADIIEIDYDIFASVADIIAAAVQDGTDTLITFSGVSSLRLTSVSVSSLHEDDFRLV